MARLYNYVRTFNSPSFVNKTTGQVMPNDTGWQTRHMSALAVPRGFEASITAMIQGWALFADEYRKRSESPIGEDNALGHEWGSVGRAIIMLLNGETGRLDCGTLHGFIRDTMETEGVRE